MTRVAPVVASLALGLALGLGTAGCPETYTSCLAEGTRVSTPSGDEPIESLRVGDTVWSVDPIRRTRVARRITAIRTARRHCLELTTAAGHRVLATPDHPFYAAGERRYRGLATMVRETAQVLSGPSLGKDDIVSIRGAPGLRRVFDLTLDGPFHSFLANGILVHNKSMPAPTIADVVTIQNAATMDTATYSDGYLAGAGTGTAATLMRAPFTGGAGMVHVTSAVAFDTILFQSTYGHGILTLVLPAAVTTVDLLVTLGANISTLDLTVVVVRGGDEGMPAQIQVPADG